MAVMAVVAVVAVAWLAVRTAGGGSSTGPGSQAGAAQTAVPTGTASSTDSLSGLPWIAGSALPPEGRATLALIRVGGPYPYPRNDDKTFANREGLLPQEPRGYYREYTVPTPGSDDRGPRRIIAGSGGERYWTDDHYASFSRIWEGT